jgi:neutral ceramidase
VIVPEFAGASGNIDPWYRVLPGFNTTNNWVPEPVLLGTMLGEEVVTVANQFRERDSIMNVTIKSAIKTVRLQRKAREQVEPAATESDAPILVTVAAVGEIAFVGLGGEVFNEIGLEIKKASPFAHTIVMTHCNGAAGYLPISSAYPEGGYEVTTSPFAAGADVQLVREVESMLKELRK